MKTKGILKFKNNYSKGGMHYVVFNNNKVSITLSSSNKVKAINEKGSLLIANNLLSRNFVETKITIIDKKDEVKEVFEYMKQIKNTHYKKWNDELVVLQYTL